MKGKAIILGLTCFLTLSLSTKVFSAEFHVTTADELRNALMTAQSNGEDDSIYLAAGIYKTGTASFSHRPEGDEKVVIQAETDLSAENVILDGENMARVLYVNAEDYDANIEIKKITIQNGNNEDDLGGGFFIDTKGTVNIQDSIIKENTGIRGGGGRVKCTHITISNTMFNGNVSSKQGGGLNIYYGDAAVSNSTFSNNTASGDGGGIYIEDDSYARNPDQTITISHSMFSSNTCGGDNNNDGGGVYAGNYATVDHSTFNSNTAGNNGDGGGLYIGKDATISDSTFFSNKTHSGGGIYFNGNSAILVNNIIAKNVATDGGGGIYYRYVRKGVITNNTITENQSDTNGDGIYFYTDNECTFEVYNSIIYDNDTEDIFIYGDGAVYAYNNDYGTLAGQHFAGWGDNIQEDPLFVNPTGNDYHIQSSSPCVNAGHAAAPELPETDFEGDPRDSPPDIGADEIPGTAPNSTTTTVVSGCKVSISPESETVAPGGTIQFSANTKCNSEEVAGTYTWELDSTIGSTIDASGLYTAGNTEGTDTLIVTDTANGDIQDSAVITISQTITTTTTTADITTTTTTAPPTEIKVDFIGSPTFGFAPLTVNFTNQSAGSISSYLWNFGDGSTSEEENPTYNYTDMGNFTVELIAYGTDGSSKSEIKPNYIFVLPGCPFATALDNQEDINTLRTLRDSILTNVFGLIATYLYYQNSSEITSIIVENSKLQDELKNLVSENISAAVGLINGGSVSFPKDKVDDVIDFLNDLKTEGSPGLKSDITLVIEAIKAGYFLYGLGVKVE